jgi:type VI protein secretion system component VasF
MTARQPRRARRNALPAPSLPRPSAIPEAERDEEQLEETGVESAAARLRRRRGNAPVAGTHHREHHVNRDYSYVHRDLITVGVVGAIVVAFIVAMSFVV